MKISVRVHARAAQEMVKADEAGWLHVYVCAAPEKNKANRALIKLLAKRYRVAKSRVRIIKGNTSSKKIIFIER